LAFAAAGAEVVVNDLRLERATAVAEEILSSGGKARPSAFDVTDYAAVLDEVQATGPIDVLVNNAGNAGADGFTERRRFAETEPEEWEPYLRVNLYGATYTTRAVHPAMIERNWGRIITVVSDAGRTGDPYSAAYSASKAGAAGLTRSVAIEVGRFGITVNNIALGTMRTPLAEALWAEHADSPQAKAILANYVVRRPGVPDDVSHLAVLPASDYGSWIRGQTIPVNGGFSFAR